MMTGKKQCIIAVVLLAVFIVGALGDSPNRVWRSVDPDLFTPCNRNSETINTCIRDQLRNIIPKLKDGIPSLNIEKCEPFSVGNIILEKNGLNFNIRTQLKNIQMNGFANMQVEGVMVHSDYTAFKIKIHSDQVVMSANYEFTGDILTFPVNGVDKFQATSTDLNTLITMETKKVQKDGKDHLEVVSVLYPISIGAVKFNFEGLNYGGFFDINEFLSQNWQLVNADMNALFEIEMANVVTRLANKFFNKYSFDEIFPQ